AGQVRRLARGGDAADAQPGPDALAEGVDEGGRGAAGAQADDAAVGDQFQGALGNGPEFVRIGGHGIALRLTFVPGRGQNGPGYCIALAPSLPVPEPGRWRFSPIFLVVNCVAPRPALPV